MAKKRKKGSSRRRSYKKKKKSKPAAKSAAVAGGMVIGVGKVVMTRPPNNYAPLTTQITSSATLEDKAANVVEVLKSHAADVKTYYGPVGGAALSATKKVPGLRLMARPIDQLIKGMTRGRWGL